MKYCPNRDQMEFGDETPETHLAMVIGQLLRSNNPV